jgi:hypothetical protein
VGGAADVVIPVRESDTASVGALAIALPLGAIAGFLFATLGLVLTDSLPATGDVTGQWLLIFFGGWIGASWFMAHHARRLITVFIRACMIGGLQWLGLYLMRVPPVMAATSNSVGAPGAQGTAWIDRLELLTGPLALAMAVVCLLGMLLALRLRREWQESGLLPR